MKIEVAAAEPGAPKWHPGEGRCRGWCHVSTVKNAQQISAPWSIQCGGFLKREYPKNIQYRVMFSNKSIIVVVLKR